jgi:hypothetical protein
LTAFYYAIEGKAEGGVVLKACEFCIGRRWNKLKRARARRESEKLWIARKSSGDGSWRIWVIRSASSRAMGPVAPSADPAKDLRLQIPSSVNSRESAPKFLRADSLMSWVIACPTPRPITATNADHPWGNALSWGVVCRFKGASDAEITRQKEEAEQLRWQAAWVSLKQELKDDLAKAPGALAEIVVESLAASAKVVGTVRKLFPWFKP